MSVIIFDLVCEREHPFEGWFTDRAAFDSQREQGLVTCPICGSSEARIVPSSITVMGKKGQRHTEEQVLKDMSPRKALQLFQDYIRDHFEDVGERFAEVALKIHQGEEDQRNIKGTTTLQEEENLREEGVQFIKIPLQKFDS